MQRILSERLSRVIIINSKYIDAPISDRGSTWSSIKRDFPRLRRWQISCCSSSGRVHSVISLQVVTGPQTETGCNQAFPVDHWTRAPEDQKNLSFMKAWVMRAHPWNVRDLSLHPLTLRTPFFFILDVDFSSRAFMRVHICDETCGGGRRRRGKEGFYAYKGSGRAWRL